MTYTPWRGKIRKGEQPNTIAGEITDTFGWRARITGTRTTDGYDIEVHWQEPPKSLRVPLLDDA